MRVGLILVPSLDVSGYEDCILDVKVLELRVKKWGILWYFSVTFILIMCYLNINILLCWSLKELNAKLLS